MSDFSKFLVHYADEALSLGEALTTILSGIALNPHKANKVLMVINKLQDASAAINESVPKLEKIVIQKKDIDAAVSKALPAIVKAELDKINKDDGK